MKKIFSVTVVILSIVVYSSCKKCATCTYFDEGKDSTYVSEFCGKGNLYKDQLKQYENNKYKCNED